MRTREPTFLAQNILVPSPETRKVCSNDVHGYTHSVVSTCSAITPQLSLTHFGPAPSPAPKPTFLKSLAVPASTPAISGNAILTCKLPGWTSPSALLTRAKDRADLRRLKNCHFVKANVLALSQSLEPVDAIIASRMLMVVGDRPQALREIFSALRPGGRCFIAEPTSALRARAASLLYVLFARLMGDWSTHFHEPWRAAVLDPNEFQSLIASQPWSTVTLWQDHWYQYAVCDRSC